MKKIILPALLAMITPLTFFAQQENILPENGNVGIGTLNPTSHLDVKGNVKIDSMLLVKDSILINKNARVKNDLKVEGNTTIKLDALVEKELIVEGNTILKGNLQVERDVILTSPLESPNMNGKKVVGYDLIEKKLVNLDPALFADYTYDKSCLESAKTPNGDIINPMWSNGINKIFVECPQVNVGIVTDDPKFNLDVRGTGFINRLAVGSLPGNLTIPTQFYLRSSLPQHLSSNLFLIENSQRKIFQINNDGLVQAREIKVDILSWPDYVFQPDYELMPLSKVESYIQSNSHLPNVPDAKTMEQEGVNLGEMNKILMQKVEELTLYLIEQDKRIQSLENELKTKN